MNSSRILLTLFCIISLFFFFQENTKALAAPSLTPIPSFSPDAPTVAQPNVSDSLLKTPNSSQTPYTITLIVTEPEKSQIATYYQFVAEFINKHANGAITLRYIPGRGGANAWNALLWEKDDGSVVSAMTLPTFLLQALISEKRFDQSKVVPIALLSGTPTVLWTATNGTIKSLEDLINKARHSPQNSYIAGVGSFTGHHMTTIVFNRAAGISLQYLPYLGSQESANAVLRGDALACWGAGTPAAYMPGLRPLAIASSIRSPFYPETPTFAERNIIIESSDQLGICMPNSASEETRKTVSALFISMAADADFQKQAAALGFAPSPIDFKYLHEYLKNLTEALQAFLKEYPMYEP